MKQYVIFTLHDEHVMPFIAYRAMGRQLHLSKGAFVIKVVIAEDDLLIADLLEDVLTRAGYEVCGLASTAAGAIDLCKQHHPDLAVIDMRLANGDCGTEIVVGLGNHDKPGVLYATGNAGHTGLTASDGDACIAKPYQAADIVRALKLVQELKETGTTTKPFPRNFELLQHRCAQQEAISHGTGI